MSGSDTPSLPVASATSADGSWGRVVRVAVGAVGARPTLWPVALRTVWRLAAPGWWRRPPRLPVPGVEYWQFRLVTAYGGDGVDAVPTAEDVVAYLRWCRGVIAAGG